MAVRQSHTDCGMRRTFVVGPHDAASNVRRLIVFVKSGQTVLGPSPLFRAHCSRQTRSSRFSKTDIALSLGVHAARTDGFIPQPFTQPMQAHQMHDSFPLGSGRHH